MHAVLDPREAWLRQMTQTLDQVWIFEFWARISGFQGFGFGTRDPVKCQGSEMRLGSRPSTASLPFSPLLSSVPVLVSGMQTEKEFNREMKPQMNQIRGLHRSWLGDANTSGSKNIADDPQQVCNVQASIGCVQCSPRTLDQDLQMGLPACLCLCLCLCVQKSLVMEISDCLHNSKSYSIRM